MSQKAAQLFQLFLEFFAVYTIFKGQLSISLICLLVIFIIEMYKRTYITSSIEQMAPAKTRLV